MHSSNRDRIRTLLQGIETGDPASVAVVNEALCVQHNPMTREGSEGLARLFRRLSTTSPTVTIHRMSEDGDFVLGYVEYDFAEVVSGFEVFRFEDGFAVGHWDNLQHRADAPNPSGRTMADGPTEPGDLAATEANRMRVRRFAETVLIRRDLDRLDASTVEHHPDRTDGIASMGDALSDATPAGGRAIRYERVHRVLAEGDLVLCAAEGAVDGTSSS